MSKVFGEEKMTQEKALEMITVYFNPKDFPNKFVARRFLITQGAAVPIDPPLAVEWTYDEMRKHIPKSMYKIQRDLRDEGAIVETWI